MFTSKFNDVSGFYFRSSNFTVKRTSIGKRRWNCSCTGWLCKHNFVD
jgi:hypothetical protein